MSIMVDKHKNKVLPIRPVPLLREAIAELAQEERRRETEMAILLLEEALQRRKRWPRRQPPSEATDETG